jgi:hypothetical protein
VSELTHFAAFTFGVRLRAERFFILWVFCPAHRITLVAEVPYVVSDLSVGKVRFILKINFPDSRF